MCFYPTALLCLEFYKAIHVGSIKCQSINQPKNKYFSDPKVINPVKTPHLHLLLALLALR